MKNKLTDLNDHLFEQLERLNDEDLKGDDLKIEIERSRAITGVSKQLISNAGLLLNAAKFMHEAAGEKGKLPDMMSKNNLLEN